MSQAIIKCHDKFKPLYDLPEDVNMVICIGGRGGMKTYEVSKFVAVSSTLRNKRCCVLRDERENVRESIMNEILMRYDTANQPVDENTGKGPLDNHYDRLETGLKDKRTGAMRVFSKGFRTTSSEKTATLKSVSDIDIAVIEEAEDIRDEDKFNTFADSIRKKGSIIIVILNTPDLNHWIIRRYFNLAPVPGEDGYFDIEPKQVPGLLVIKTSYLDNPHLPSYIVQKYESYGDPDSHLYNKHYYLTAIMGYASSGLKGQVFTKVKPITLAEYMRLPYTEVFGQDFGTAAAAGLVGVKIHKSQCWMRELNYEPATALDLAKLYCQLRLGPADLIVADSAEPKTITRLQKGWKGDELPEDEFLRYPALARGFNVVPADKGPDSIKNGISTMLEMELFITEESKNFWHEIRHYVYGADKDGKPTGMPEGPDHLIDPARYTIARYKKPKSNAPISV